MRALISLTALFAGLAGAFELPRTPALGSTLATLDRERFVCAAAAYGAVCRHDPAEDLVFEDQPVRAVVLFYRKGLLARATVAVDETRFTAIRNSLGARFGSGEGRSDKLKAGMGGIFNNSIVLWRDDDVTIMLEQFFERVVRSGVSVMSNREFEALMAERDAGRVRGVRDL